MRIWERTLLLTITIILLISVVGLGLLVKQTSDRLNSLEHELFLSQHLAPGETFSDVVIYLDNEVSDLNSEVVHLKTDTANNTFELEKHKQALYDQEQDILTLWQEISWIKGKLP